MKKLQLIIIFLVLAVFCYGQVPLYKNLEIRKPAPQFWGNGTGAQLKLYNSTITESDGKFIFVGGIIKLNSDTVMVTSDTLFLSNRIDQKLGLSDSILYVTPTRLMDSILAHVGDGVSYPDAGIPVSSGSSWSSSISTTGTTGTGNLVLSISPIFTETVTIPSPFYLGITSVTTTGAQFNYLNTATSNIQTQLNTKLNSADFADSLHTQTGKFYVEDYGAVGDGVTDDTDAIQDCIDDAGDATVEFPLGTFVITTLTITKGTSLHGAGMSYRTGEGTRLLSATDAPMLIIDHSLNGWDLPLKISGFNFRGDTTLHNQYGIVASGVTRMIFEDIYFLGTGNYAFKIDDNSHSGLYKIQNCEFQQCYGGIYGRCTSEAQINDILIFNNTIVFCHTKGINIFGSNITIFKNNLGGNSEQSIYIGARDIPNTTTTSDNIVIIDNYFDGDSAGVILAEGYYSAAGPVYQYFFGLIIDDNYINWNKNIVTDGTLAAIRLQLADGSTSAAVFPDFVLGGGNAFNLTGSEPIYHFDGGSCLNYTATVNSSTTTGVAFATRYQNCEGADINYRGNGNPFVARTPTAEAGITATMLHRNLYTYLEADTRITANPQIVDGYEGQLISITNSNAYTLTLRNGEGLFLQTDSIILGEKQSIELKYRKTSDLWIEQSRNNPSQFIQGKADLNAPIFYNGIITDILRVGDATSMGIDSINYVGTEAAVYDGADTVTVYTKHSDRSILMRTFAGDTANYQVPDQVGQFFLDTSVGKLYVAKTAVRGGWVILNLILFFGYIRRKKR